MNDLKDFDINEFNPGEYKSFFIEASAGTGKTYTVMEIVKKLISTGITLDRILIVTYTEKAVGELKDRIRKEISKAKSNSSCSDDDKEKFEKAYESVSSAPIFTIHSFCQETLKKASFLASVPADLSMVDDANVMNMLEEKLRDEYAEDFGKGEYEISDILKGNSGLRDILKAAVDKYYLKKDGEEDEKIVSLAAESKGDCGLTSEKEYIRGKIKEVYKEWLLKKGGCGCQSYNDMIRDMHESVCENEGKNALVEYLRDKYSYAIIDEFQDTNKKQWDIFRTIFFGGKDHVKEHALVVVGDPKQSIYSFQGADVTVYEQAKNEIKAGYRLSCNYRSTDKIINACNHLVGGGGCNKFFDIDNISFTESKCPAEGNKKPDAEYCGNKVKPIWLAAKTSEGSNQPPAFEFADEWDFARFAAGAILDCCSKDEDGKTKLRIFSKEKGKENELTNVGYGDFAILYKQKSELAPIISELKKRKIPYIRYKDKGLFAGKECADWIAMLEALDAVDYADYNRKFLNKVLFSKFFGKELEDLYENKFDCPECSERRRLQDWRELARNRNWLKLIESIFDGSGIEVRLAKQKDYDMLGRYRQIGAYVVEYLSKGNASLADCIEHLSALADAGSKEETEDEDGNIVEIGTDSKCVQVMTIHASKGLEFPVVISVAGFKGKNPNIPHCWQGHVDGELKIGSQSYKEFRDLRCKERDDDTIKPLKKELKEQGYKITKDDYAINKIKEKEEEIRKEIEKYAAGGENIACVSEKEQDQEFRRLFYVAYTRASSLLILPYYDYINANGRTQDQKPYYSFLADRFGELVQNKPDYVRIFDCNEFTGTCSDPESSEDSAKVTNDWKPDNPALKTVKEKVRDLETFKQSYSSLSKVKAGISSLDEKSVWKAGDDSYGDGVVKQADANNKIKFSGAYFGTALHEIFEKCAFEDFARDNESNAQFVEDVMKRHGFIGSDDDMKTVVGMVYSSVWAVLPKIKGSGFSSGSIRLADLKSEDCIKEGEFLFNMAGAFREGYWGRSYCNGFMDLVFRWKDEDSYRYCVLDYKSDKLDNPKHYSDRDKLKEKIDSEYSIQRVLYSYCLVQWLGRIYDLSPDEAFEEHFGGVYYLLARGTVEGKQNGIYAQTWKSYEDLEKAYEGIKSLRNKEEEGE